MTAADWVISCRFLNTKKNKKFISYCSFFSQKIFREFKNKLENIVYYWKLNKKVLWNIFPSAIKFEIIDSKVISNQRASSFKFLSNWYGYIRQPEWENCILEKKLRKKGLCKISLESIVYEIIEFLNPRQSGDGILFITWSLIGADLKSPYNEQFSMNCNAARDFFTLLFMTIHIR